MARQQMTGDLQCVPGEDTHLPARHQASFLIDLERAGRQPFKLQVNVFVGNTPLPTIHAQFLHQIKNPVNPCNF